jgi:Fe-S-cluster containining protein
MVFVTRPVWRSFHPRFLARAAAHVRAGGFAAVLHPGGRVRLLLPRERSGGLTEAALWALLAIDLRRWGSPRTGAARGLASAWLALDEDKDIVREWCERDAKNPSSTRRIRLDCLACAACCRDNRVVLEPEDFRAWRGARRDDLGRAPYTRLSNGQTVLRLQPSGRCVHLESSNHCAIYALRPSNCSAFPMGSEPCLAAREETLGIVD